MIQFPSKLIQGRLIKRYKRFLADVELEGGEIVTAHCPNSGTMLGLSEPGATVWLSRSPNVARKLAYTFELIETGGILAGVNTMHPNKLIAQAIASGLIPELAGYETSRREVVYGEASRIDILLENAGGARCYVEVKNVHLSRQPGLAEFPDCVTARGAKHLRELSQMVAQGHRAAMVFCVQRGDAERFDLAADIDPVYAHTFDKAVSSGVEALCYTCEVTLDGLEVSHKLPIIRASHNKEKLKSKIVFQEKLV